MTTTTTPTAEALSELDTATADVQAAEADVQALTSAIESGAESDPSKLEQAESRRRFAFLRRKGAAARVEAAHAAEHAAKLEALDAAVSAWDGPARIRTAETTFTAAVEAAATAYARTVSEVNKNAEALFAQARAAGIEYGENDPERGIRPSGWHFNGQGLCRDAGAGTAVATPYPATHGYVERARLKAATEAYRRGAQAGGAR